MGLLLFHNYLHNSDGDIILLMEINELEQKLKRLTLTPFVRSEINKMLKEKRIDYERSKTAKDFLTGLIEFERSIEEYTEEKDILYHNEQLINKLHKFNPKFDAKQYIQNYMDRKESPKNPFVTDQYTQIKKYPRKQLKRPKNDLVARENYEGQYF